MDELIPIALFAMIAAIVILPRYFRSQERQKMADTLRLASVGSTGTRALAQYGVATAVFDDAINEWLIAGTGLT